tara:strand:- start:575 stop:712 length:138 start_codon:yes stop_codon:yes gene_type:complete
VEAPIKEISLNIETKEGFAHWMENLYDVQRLGGEQHGGAPHISVN